MAQKLAIHGGQPVRVGAYPAWPLAGAREEELLRQVLASPHWGANSPLVGEFERLNVGLLVHGQHDSVLGRVSKYGPTPSAALRLNSGSVETHSRGIYN